MKVLVMAAHPDDEVLGCGGTIARMIKQGDEVKVLFMSGGVTSRPDYLNSEITNMRTNLIASCKYLGCEPVSNIDLPDNRFDSKDLLDVVRHVEWWVETIKPEIVFTHHVSDLNVDHQIIAKATLTATRPMQGGILKGLLFYEVPSSTEWGFGQIKPVFQPNVFVDISNTLENKIEALKLYKSEIREYPHPRSPEAIRAIAQKWGSTVGMKAAEAFQLIWALR